MRGRPKGLPFLVQRQSVDFQDVDPSFLRMTILFLGVPIHGYPTVTTY
jgi:hypothetical protein